MNTRNTLIKSARSLGIAVLCCAVPAITWAGGSPTGGTISFVPAAASQGASAVPTLGGAMLILLALLLAFIVFNNLRQQRIKAMLAVALAGGALVSALGGVTLIERATAGIEGAKFLIANSQGQSFPIQPNIFNSYGNNAGTDMRVQNVQLPPGCTNGPVPRVCSAGLELQQGEDCQIDCGAVQGSDRRLKTDVIEVATTHNGLPLYHFRYIGGQELYAGVMAQDVLAYMPAAVLPGANGYLAVNYQMLGLQMTLVE